MSTWKKSTASAVGRLGAQELPPAQVAAALRRRRDPGPLEDPADGRGGDPVAELAQLALDALVAPRGVVPGEPFDQRGDLVGQRRAAGAVRVGPLPGDQASVPAQNRRRGHQPVVLQRLRQQPDQRGQDRPVGPVQARPRVARAAGPRPRGATRAARRPSTRWSGPAAPASRRSG